ncbi:MAG: tripartite tricarboxylate transporter substrate binding protein, partial [Roseococcus sp.]
MLIPSRRLILGAGTDFIATPALAQPRWPVRAVQLLCPWAAGGGTVPVGRSNANPLVKALGLPFNVINRN